MRTATASGILVATVALLSAPLPADAGDPKADAMKAFVTLQGTCKGGDAAALEAALPSKIGEPVAGSDAGALQRWRKGLAASIAAAKLLEVRVGKEAAVARCTGAAGSEVEYLLGRSGDAWSLSAPLGYVVKGKEVDAVNGRAPAKVRLDARTTNGREYGSSAVSLAHVTQDPAQCLNRMDLWYCHNGDLHAGGDGRIARVIGKTLADAKGIPEYASWEDDLAPETGGVYVMRCRREGEYDFFVRIAAVSVTEAGADLEWSILGAGSGHPAGLKRPQPYVPDRGPDGKAGRPGAAGTDGLCGRNGGGRRSTPTPEPVPEPTVTPPATDGK